MDTLRAFAMGQATMGREAMVFDWDKAARRIVESGAMDAEAGLRADWEWTGGIIFANGEPTTAHYTYLSSTWAVPELQLDGVREPCFRMESQSPGWNSATKWPESALAVLRGEPCPVAALPPAYGIPDADFEEVQTERTSK